MKNCILLFFCLTTVNVVGQYKEQLLKINKFLPYIRNLELNSDTYPEWTLKDSLTEQFNWDFNDLAFYENLLNEMKDEKVDYRFLLILAKLASLRDSEDTKNEGIVWNYYKNKFAELSIDNGINLSNEVRDTLKYNFIERYQYVSLQSEYFPSYEIYKSYTDKVMMYIQDLLFYPKYFKTQQISFMYWTKSSILYDINYLSEKDSSALNAVFLNLKLAIDYNKANYDAFKDRAGIKYTILKDYNGAVDDYKALLNLKLMEIKYDKYTLLYPVYGILGDCHYNMNRFTEAILFYKKAIADIELKIKENPKSSDILKYKNAEGEMHLSLAYCYHFLKTQSNACIELRKAINCGYNVKELNNLLTEFKCK